MRAAQLFRNGNSIRVLRPFWDSSRSQKFWGSSLNEKSEALKADPYEGNFSFIECDQYTKVSVIGAAGRVGKTLSLLLKTCPLIDHLCLFDTDKSVKGVGVDISHIDTKCNVSYVCGMRNIQQALNAPDIVIITAGCPASPNLKGKKLFEKNAPIIAGISEACARFCPKACIILITNPINSLLPVIGSVYQIITNKIPSRRLFGLTNLDVVRANTFVAEVVRKDPSSVIVPVIGGTSQDTIVPVISQMKPCYKIKRGETVALTECLKRAEENLMDCQNCGTRGASSLSTAYAGFRFTSSLVMALKGAENVVECAFVKSDIIPELEYLASPLKLGIRGIEYNFGYPPLSEVRKPLEEFPEEKPDEETVSNTDLSEIVCKPTVNTSGFLQKVPSQGQPVRNYHTSPRENSGSSNREKIFFQDSRKMLIPIGSATNDLEILSRRKTRRYPINRNGLRVNQCKNLNASAKQKFRSFNIQKKFMPSASVLLLLDKKKRERAGKNMEIVVAEAKLKKAEEEKRPEVTKAEEDEEEKVKDHKEKKSEDKQLMVQKEKDRYKDFIFRQLEDLKKENEELKKQLSKMSSDRRLETALHNRSDNLELERTKLKACWLIMSSTMDAFSNFCRKFTTKSDAKCASEQQEEDKEEEFDDALESLDEESAGDETKGKEKKTLRYDEKYFRFLQKLMEDQIESQLDDTKRNRMRK